MWAGVPSPEIYEFKQDEEAKEVDWQLKTPQVVGAGEVPVWEKITGNAEEKKDA